MQHAIDVLSAKLADAKIRKAEAPGVLPLALIQTEMDHYRSALEILIEIDRVKRQQPHGDDMSDSIEKEIKAKGLTAPRVTPQMIENSIAEEYTFTAAAALKGTPGETSQSCKLLTICVLVLKNGFSVTGDSACASPENFDAELGARIARGHAKDKIWALEGYLLKQTLAVEGAGRGGLKQLLNASS